MFAVRETPTESLGFSLSVGVWAPSARSFGLSAGSLVCSPLAPPRVAPEERVKDSGKTGESVGGGSAPSRSCAGEEEKILRPEGQGS